MAHVVGDELRPGFVDGHADGPPKGVAVLAHEAGENVFGAPEGLPLSNGTKITL